jgi:phosphoribosylamine--glycine ligase
MCIVLCANGYPDNYEKNIEIKNISNLKKFDNSFLFHAGTKLNEKKIYSIGGRVLNFVGIEDELFNARKKIINQINELNWNKGFFRKDIGFKAIDG